MRESKSQSQQVHDFWNEASCGENLLLEETDQRGYESQAKLRYELEPYIATFARFEESRYKRLLEIGVGLGADHQKFAEAGAILHGIDLTERAIRHTRERFAMMGLVSSLAVGDAEHLLFPDEYFDIVYSWGVLHHSPDTSRCIEEVHRVLKRDGTARVMIYHKWSLVGFMLWTRYALLRGRPFTSLTEIYARYLESPGTKAYSIAAARELFSAFNVVKIRTILTHGDLLESGAGQRHTGRLLRLARRIWPRRILKRMLPSWGLFMLIEAKK